MNKNEIINILKNNGIKIKDNIKIEDNENYITSRIDGSKRKRIYGNYLKKLGITSKQYNILFPDAPLYCEKDKKNTNKNCGLHMKNENYKKIFSEKIKGELNPNHKSKTTKKQRNERSPFNINFYLKNNNFKKSDNLKNDFIKKVSKIRKYNTKREYFLTDKEYKERQKTFSYEKCIEKYGKIKGKEIFTNRQIKWHKSLKKNLKCGYSKASQELFNKIILNFNDHENFKFATLNNEFYIKRSDKKGIWKFLYHANPKIYNEKDNPHPFRKNLTSKEIWEKDENKYKDAKNNNFKIKIIWDSEFKNNPNKILKECLEFLK